MIGFFDKLILLLTQFEEFLIQLIEECEIEDLFTKEMLALILNGKTFSRCDQFNIDQYYGKDIFSKYILAHYLSIEFKRFIPLLDAVNHIVEVCNADPSELP